MSASYSNTDSPSSWQVRKIAEWKSVDDSRGSTASEAKLGRCDRRPSSKVRDRHGNFVIHNIHPLIHACFSFFRSDRGSADSVARVDSLNVF